MSAAHLLHGRHNEAIAAADTAVDRQPNEADAHAYRGLALALAGRPDEGAEAILHAIRLNPGFSNGPYLNILGLARFLAGDHAGSIAAFEENMAKAGPVGPPALAWAAGAVEGLGDHERAKGFAARAIDMLPTFRLTGWNLFELLRDTDQGNRTRRLMHAAGIPD